MPTAYLLERPLGTAEVRNEEENVNPLQRFRVVLSRGLVGLRHDREFVKVNPIGHGVQSVRQRGGREKGEGEGEGEGESDDDDVLTLAHLPEIQTAVTKQLEKRLNARKKVQHMKCTTASKGTIPTKGCGNQPEITSKPNKYQENTHGTYTRQKQETNKVKKKG